MCIYKSRCSQNLVPSLGHDGFQSCFDNSTAHPKANAVTQHPGNGRLTDSVRDKLQKAMWLHKAKAPAQFCETHGPSSGHNPVGERGAPRPRQAQKPAPCHGGIFHAASNVHHHCLGIHPLCQACTDSPLDKAPLAWIFWKVFVSTIARTNWIQEPHT